MEECSREEGQSRRKERGTKNVMKAERGTVRASEVEVRCERVRSERESDPVQSEGSAKLKGHSEQWSRAHCSVVGDMRPTLTLDGQG